MAGTRMHGLLWQMYKKNLTQSKCLVNELLIVCHLEIFVWISKSLPEEMA